MAETPGTIPKYNRRAKIAIIGGGSLYCADFINNIVKNPQALKGSHLVLVDKNEDHLELIYTISTKLFRNAGIEITIEHTTSQEEAIEDADFILTTFRTGGLHASAYDEQVLRRHGLISHSTIGPGGFFYALRTAPVLAGIAAQAEKTAPRAFLLNYSTPSNIVIEAVAHSSGIRTIGLRDNAIPEALYLAQQAGFAVDASTKLYPRTIGLNRNNWTTAVWHNGRDILPSIVDWCKSSIQTAPAMTATNYQQIMNATLTAHYNAIPSDYMHYYYFPEIVLDYQHKQLVSLLQESINALPRFLDHYRQEAQKDVPQITTLPGHEHVGNFALAILRSILADTGEEWVLNVQNNGSINFLADDRVVELPCRVDARGATPLTQGDGGLGMEQRGLIALLAEYEGATARVALWGSRRDAIKALAANPLVLSYSKAEKLYDELAAVNAQYLPERLLQ